VLPPVPGDPIVGYISLGKGITIHHDTRPNAEALKRTRSASPRWRGRATPRRRSRMFAETGIQHPRGALHRGAPDGQDRFVVEVGDTQALKTCVARLRNIESVFDAYRVTPTG
jgi:guanosine-3',5'-bis(diphosphate) 3'-pyrophosphohydrolase